jgi:hypothetical protein
LDELKGTRRYWKFKAEAQDRTLWRTQFGRGSLEVTRQQLVSNWLILTSQSDHAMSTSQSLNDFLE